VGISKQLKMWFFVVGLTLLACANSSNVGNQEGNTIIPTEIEEVRFGYSTQDRKQIFYELVFAEDVLQIIANSLFPTPDPLSDDYTSKKMEDALFGNLNYFNENLDNYHIGVANK